MSTIEDRLSAALNARADLVQLEDLRPAEPPATVVPLRRRPTTWLLAAAACALMVGVPLLALDGGDGDDEPVGPTTEAPSARPTPRNDAEGADWPKVRSFGMYDVDGDGIDDKVVTRTESGQDVTQEPWRVEVHLSSGGIASTLVPTLGGWEVNPTGDVADVDGDGADEIVYYNGRGSDFGSTEIGVLQYDGGNLLDFTVPTDPGLTSQLDEQGSQRAWLVDGEKHLVSLRSVEGGYVPASEDNPLGERFPVDTWTWTIDDGALVPVPGGRQCVLAANMKLPFPCSQDGPTPPAGTFPEATESRGIGESFTVDVDGDGAEDTVALDGPAGRTDTIEDGEVELTVTLGGGAELRAPVPAGWVPQVFTTPYVGPDNQRGLLLEQEGGDATAMTLYLLAGDALVVAEPDAAHFFGNGYEGPDVDVRTWTWLTEDGRLWLRTTPMAEIELDDWQFYQWTQVGDRGLEAEPAGRGCWEC